MLMGNSATILSSSHHLHPLLQTSIYESDQAQGKSMIWSERKCRHEKIDAREHMTNTYIYGRRGLFNLFFHLLGSRGSISSCITTSTATTTSSATC